MRIFLTYATSLPVFCSIIFIPQAIGSREDMMLLPLYIGGTAIMAGIWAAIPVFGIWIPLVLVFEKVGLAPRARSVLATGIAAYFGAIISSKIYVEAFRDMTGEKGVSHLEIALLTVIAAVISFVVWTVSPQREEQE